LAVTFEEEYDMAGRTISVRKQRAITRARDKLFQYLSNPEHDLIPRSKYSVEILGYAHSPRVYDLFTPSQLSQIESEALNLRRQQYATNLARIDQGLIKRAIEGDPAACKLAYQKFENWSPGERRQVDLTSDVKVAVFKELLQEIADANSNFQDLAFTQTGKKS